MGKIINFPTPFQQEKFIEDSGRRTKALIEALTMSANKGMLNERFFFHLLASMQLDINRDFTISDLAIIKFHCENYYLLQLSIW